MDIPVPDAPVEPVVTPEPPAVVEPPKPEPKKSLEDSLASLDEDTRTYVLGEVAKARKEAGDSRTTAKAQAAEAARNEMAQAVGKALGLIKDDETADPAKLTEQLSAVSSDARQAKVELAVFRAAQGVNADPSALLDSRSFLAKLADVDPADHLAVAAAVGEAISENPSLVKGDGRRLPAPNPAVGSSASGGPTLDDQMAAAVKSGDVKAQIHLQNQKLAALKR